MVNVRRYIYHTWILWVIVVHCGPCWCLLFKRDAAKNRLFLTNTGLDVQMTKDGYDIQSLEKKSSRNTPEQPCREMYWIKSMEKHWRFIYFIPLVFLTTHPKINMVGNVLNFLCKLPGCFFLIIRNLWKLKIVSGDEILEWSPRFSYCNFVGSNTCLFTYWMVRGIVLVSPHFVPWDLWCWHYLFLSWYYIRLILPPKKMNFWTAYILLMVQKSA